MFKEILDISVEDPLGVAKLQIVAWKLLMGPETTLKIIKSTPEGTVLRMTKCTCWETYNEFEVNPAFRNCDLSHQAFMEDGLKVINPQLSFKVIKVPQTGDPYCEFVIEFKAE